MNLAALDEFLARSLTPYRETPRVCGVYVLSNVEDEILYVGQSVNIAARIRQHREEKEFSTVHYIEVPKEDLNRVEAWMIRFCRPVLNRTSFEPSSRGRAEYMRAFRKRPVVCPACGHTFTELKRVKE